LANSRLIAMSLIIFTLLLTGCSFLPQKAVYKQNGISMVSRVEGENLLCYAEGKWQKHFWYGVNLGATTPGHSPGELSPNYDDYLRWFSDMESLGVDLVRIYTILPPDFYRALAYHNESAKRKLWFIQGIWPPEEELIKKQDAYHDSITTQFNEEISLAVRAVYGRGEISPRQGHACGSYTVNTAPYLLAWMVGSEWDPFMVQATNEKNRARNNFRGKYFVAGSQAGAFDAWLAAALENLAVAEAETGWQHPVTFVNWVTTDPLQHTDEPFPREDLVSVDPTHIVPTKLWQAGYFASYHVYPYYPDSLVYQQDYRQYINKDGVSEPYEGYVRQLKDYHRGMPLVVAEFGVPSSRGMAHRGTLGRNQGMHTEKEQGDMDVSMFRAIKDAGAAGAILFSWQDEWFKFTWNTLDLEIPGERRPMWLNKLTNEENFGLIAVEPGARTKVFLDGDTGDWDIIDKPETVILEDGKTKLMVSHDEAYLYLALQATNGDNWRDKEIYLGFDTVPGGNMHVAGTSITFSQGTEFLLHLKVPGLSGLEVASAYDQHTYLYGYLNKMIRWDSTWAREDNGVFLPWKLSLSKGLYLPASKRKIPFDEITVGKLISGNTNPEAKDFNSLADYYADGKVLEVRLPWMMLGFTDPSTHQVWAYPYRKQLKGMSSVSSPGINIFCISQGDIQNEVKLKPALFYNWDNWDEPSYHERRKVSFYVLQNYLRVEKKY